MSERSQMDQQATEEAHFRLLRILEEEPHLSQREIAKRMGISLGKVNYCIRALAERGLIKAGNFYRSQNKRAYLYRLTPRGITERAAMAIKFLRYKEAEHRQLMLEIEALREEVKQAAQSLATKQST